MAASPKHFVFTPFFLLSHFRQMIGLAINLMREHPDLIVTVLTHKLILVPVEIQFKTSGLSEDTLKRRLRVVGLVERNPTLPGLPGMFQMYDYLGEDLPQAYQTVVDGGRLKSEDGAGTIYDLAGLPAPSVVIGDSFSKDFARTVKTITPNTKALVLFCSTAGSFNRHFAPSALDGMGEWEQETRKAMEDDPVFAGLSFEEAANKLRHTFSGRVITSSDGVQRYDYEHHTQSQMPAMVFFLLNATKQVLKYSDGSILPTTRSFEPGATKDAIEWYSRDSGRPIFFVGPQFLPGQYALEPRSFVRPPVDHPVFDFLDRHPPKSVWLISFGTVHYPVEPSQVHTLFKVLIATGTPFIHSGASRAFDPTLIPAELRQQITDSGLGLMVDGFVPQQEVLAHPSMGAFVSHAGNGSLWESIMAGVIGVFWPFAADQPYHAAYASCGLDCAFELIQVRTGDGAKPPKRGGGFEGTEEALTAEVTQVVNDLKGETGTRKRANLERVRRETFEALAEGGDASADAQKLVALDVSS